MFLLDKTIIKLHLRGNVNWCRKQITINYLVKKRPRLGKRNSRTENEENWKAFQLSNLENIFIFFPSVNLMSCEGTFRFSDGLIKRLTRDTQAKATARHLLRINVPRFLLLSNACYFKPEEELQMKRRVEWCSTSSHSYPVCWTCSLLQILLIKRHFSLSSS